MSLGTYSCDRPRVQIPVEPQIFSFSPLAIVRAIVLESLTLYGVTLLSSEQFHVLLLPFTAVEWILKSLLSESC